MKCKGFKNTNIYIYGKGIVHTSLSIQNQTIDKIEDQIDQEDLLELDKRFIVLPGFIDKHIHGANGSDFMNPTKKDIENILSVLVKEGTTSCLATTMTQSIDLIKSALKNLAEYIQDNPIGTEILGIHLEGPFISKKHAGAQPLEYILPCDIALFDSLNESASGHIQQVTIAYEENGYEFTKHLKEQCIVVSLGHTDCSYDLAEKAIRAGATSVSHTYNAMTGFHHRDAGVVGAALLHEELYSELICDLIHVSKPAVQVLYKNKKNRICLITDAMEAKWMPDGNYQLGGQEVIVKDKEARLKDGTLAGSTLKMNEAIRNFMEATHCSLIEAVDAATILPAACLGVDNRKGSIEIGKDADFVIVDENLDVYMTICRGEIVYSKL